MSFMSCHSAWASEPPHADFLAQLWPPDKAKLIRASLTDRYYPGVNNTRNYYAEFTFPQGKIEEPLIVVTGLEDPIPLWFDFVLLAQQRGFKKIYIIELRGQGQSERIAGGKKPVIHVNEFSNYYADLVSAFADINQRQPFTKSIYLMSHSTGTLVTVKSLARLQKQFVNLKIAKMSFWAPLVKLNISPLLNNFVVRPLLDRFESVYARCCGLLLGRKYGPSEFNKNGLTTDPVKFKLSEVLKRQFGFGSRGVSLRWGMSALKEAENFLENDLENLEIPSLLLKGSIDPIVNNNFRIKNPRIKIHSLAGAMHALHIEKDSILQQATEKTFSFFLED